MVGHADLLLRSEALRQTLRPELLLQVGGGLTSKRLGQWLDGCGAERVLFAEDDSPVDAAHRASLVLSGDLASMAEALTASAAPRRTPWTEAFLAADSRADVLLAEAFAAAGPLSEPQLAHHVVSALPDGARLVVASSMPVRDVDAFAPGHAARIRVLSNRGLNGIDGTISTALGVAAASAAPTVVLLGDLAFFHDLGGLLLSRRSGIGLTVVVANNDGGGIFSFLPIAGVGMAFEPLFGTPHGLELGHAAALFGARYHRVEQAGELSAALAEGLKGGVHLVEARLPSRTANVGLHQDLGDRAARAAEAAP